MTPPASIEPTISCMSPLLLMLGLTKYYEEKIKVVTKSIASMAPILPKEEPLTIDVPVEPYILSTI